MRVCLRGVCILICVCTSVSLCVEVRGQSQMSFFSNTHVFGQVMSLGPGAHKLALLAGLNPRYYLSLPPWCEITSVFQHH